MTVHELIPTLAVSTGGWVAIVVILIGREVWIILQARRKGRAAARLHIRIVGLFALVAGTAAGISHEDHFA